MTYSTYNEILLPTAPEVSDKPALCLRKNTALGRFDAFYDSVGFSFDSLTGVLSTLSGLPATHYAVSYPDIGWEEQPAALSSFIHSTERRVFFSSVQIMSGPEELFPASAPVQSDASSAEASFSELSPYIKDIASGESFTLTFASSSWKTDHPEIYTVTDGNKPFYVSTTWYYNGTRTLRSGSPGHSGTSQTTINFNLETDGAVEFSYIVSSEGPDYLRVYVDGTRVVNVSGTSMSAFDIYSKQLSKGPHTLRLEYYKDVSVNTGKDAGAIGHITFTGVGYNGLKKWLIKDDSGIYSGISGTWHLLPPMSITESLFVEFGSDEPPAAENVSGLSNPSILYWEDSERLHQLSADVRQVPLPQILYSQEFDCSHESILSILMIIATASSDVAFQFYFGGSWQVFKDEAWVQTSNTVDGQWMDTAEVNFLTSESYLSPLYESGSYRLAIKLAQSDSLFTKLVIKYLN